MGGGMGHAEHLFMIIIHEPLGQGVGVGRLVVRDEEDVG